MAEIIIDWLPMTTETGKDGSKKYMRPLPILVHRKPVMEALANAIPAELAGVGFIDWGVPQHKRQLVADRLQNGEIGVIVCSTGAAGFGITLTASSDAIFVETGWTPANISQAKDLNVVMPGADDKVTVMTAALNEDENVYEVLTEEDKELEKESSPWSTSSSGLARISWTSGRCWRHEDAD